MRLSFTCIVFATLLTVSCSKKDSGTAPNQCLYIGKTVLRETPTVGQKTSYGNEISWNDQKQMATARSFSKTEGFSNISNNVLFTDDNQTNFSFIYDSEGFLTQKVMKRTSVHLGEGMLGTTYEGRKYENFVDETNEISDYKYESGRIMLVNIQSAKRLLGNGEILLDTTFNYIKTYTYDGQGNPVSATETVAIGKIVSTFKNGVLASLALANTAGQWQLTEEYDEKGNRTAVSGISYRYKYTRDAKGNLASAEYIVNNKPVYTQEYTYDDRLNPESAIPRNFKGIPDPMLTIPVSTSTNNQTGEKYNGFQISSSYENNAIFLYNANGLPESSTGTRSGEETGLTETTRFRYKCP
jgi:hypothetical protein